MIFEQISGKMKVRKKNKHLAPRKPKTASQENKKPDFLDWNGKILLSSVKRIDMGIILIIALDMMFYYFCYYLFMFWLQRIQGRLLLFNLPADASTLGAERTQQLVGEAKMFLYILVFSFILLLLAIIFIASIINGVIWAKVTKTKASLSLISRFLALNLIWMGFWFVLAFLISWLAEPGSIRLFIIAAIAIAYYFTNALYSIFMRNQKIRSILDSIRLGTAKLHLFLIPYIVIFLIFYIIFELNSLLAFDRTPGYRSGCI